MTEKEKVSAKKATLITETKDNSQKDIKGPQSEGY
jgi:hypothetical protein